MKLIKPSFLIKEQESGLLGIYRQIEYAGRICYKSSDKITEDSAKPFVDRMIASQHYAMLEHGTVYLHIEDYFNSESSKAIAHYTGTDCIISTKFSIDRMKTNPYSKCVIRRLGMHGRQAYITTNYRVLVENGWLDDLKYLCEPTEFHEKRVTVKFILSRSVAQEYTRHRALSFAMESQRYCNYSSDKFNNEVTFIVPCWMSDEQRSLSLESRDICGNTYAEVCFKESLIKAEKVYFILLKEGWRPQQAREVLPNACKTELVMTGFVSDWKHFFELRCASSAHPQARELAIPLKEEFLNRKYILN